jgi:hypothetical protein
MSRSWQSDVQLNYQTNNTATTALSWIIHSFYFEYRSPIRLRNNFINPIQSEMNIFVPKSERIGFGSDLHTSSLMRLYLFDKWKPAPNWGLNCFKSCLKYLNLVNCFRCLTVQLFSTSYEIKQGTLIWANEASWSEITPLPTYYRIVCEISTPAM